MIHYNNYNAAQAAGEGSRSLPAGGYVAQIVGAIMTETRKTHEPMLEVRIEILEGEFRGIFNSKVQQPGTWPNAGIYRLPLPSDPNVAADDFRLSRLKGLITSIEESNQNFRWRDDERDLRGKIVGVVYRDEEFFSERDGQKHVSAKPYYFCSVNRIRTGDFQIPKPRLLEENAQARPNTYTSVPQDAGFGDFVPVDSSINGDKDLPF